MYTFHWISKTLEHVVNIDEIQKHCIRSKECIYPPPPQSLVLRKIYSLTFSLTFFSSSLFLMAKPYLWEQLHFSSSSNRHTYLGSKVLKGFFKNVSLGIKSIPNDKQKQIFMFRRKLGLRSTFAHAKDIWTVLYFFFLLN